jgi:Domain of unknown function (DUF4383)
VHAEARVEGVRERAPIQDVALLLAIAFVGIGIAGFIPGLTTDYDDLSFAGNGSRAQLFGVFQTSILHNLIHLLFGVAGIALARTRPGARTFLVGGGLVYVLLFFYGLVTSESSGANFVPFDASDDVLHLALGGSMLVLGLLPESVPGAGPETLAGFLASLAIFVAAVGLAYRPLRLIPLAILLALVATGIGGRATRLATGAVFICGACFAVGLAVAVVTSNPLW